MNIYDIAEKCGVSIATVSRVINNSSSVSKKTREHVLKIMRDLNYTPNAFARGLGLNTMNMIGLMCTDVSDIHYSKAVSLMEHNLRSRGFDTLLCCTGTANEDISNSVKLLMDKRVDAIVLIGSAYAGNETMRYISNADRNIPFFLINGFIDNKSVISVLCDEKKAIYDSVKLLYKNGCKDILYIYDIETYSGSQKLSGYNKAINEFGLNKHIIKTDKTLESAYEGTKNALTSRVDAIIASEDILAIGALKASGGKLPIIGFNNSTLAKCCSPELTSIDNRLDDICPKLSDMIEKFMAGEKIEGKTVFPAKLVVRQSFIPE